MDTIESAFAATPNSEVGSASVQLALWITAYLLCWPPKWAVSLASIVLLIVVTLSILHCWLHLATTSVIILNLNGVCCIVISVKTWVPSGKLVSSCCWHSSLRFQAIQASLISGCAPSHIQLVKKAAQSLKRLVYLKCEVIVWTATNTRCDWPTLYTNKQFSKASHLPLLQSVSTEVGWESGLRVHHVDTSKYIQTLGLSRVWPFISESLLNCWSGI